MSLPDNPMVTVAICTYNGLADLREVLDDLLAQTYDNYEILVVDNNSTDGTAEYMHQRTKATPHLRYCQEAQQGKSFALNKSLKEARGELLAFIDQDCRVGTDWLERIVESMQQTGVDGVGGIVRMDLQGRQSWVTRLLLQARVIPGFYYQGDQRREVDWLMGCNMCLRQRVFEEVGGFHTAVVEYGVKKGYGHEVDLCIRARKVGFRLVYDPAICVLHTIPPERQTLAYAISSNFWIAVANSLIKRPVNYQAAANIHPIKVLFNAVSIAGRLYALTLRKQPSYASQR